MGITFALLWSGRSLSYLGVGIIWSYLLIWQWLPVTPEHINLARYQIRICGCVTSSVLFALRLPKRANASWLYACTGLAQTKSLCNIWLPTSLTAKEHSSVICKPGQTCIHILKKNVRNDTLEWKDPAKKLFTDAFISKSIPKIKIMPSLKSCATSSVASDITWELVRKAKPAPHQLHWIRLHKCRVEAPVF